MRRYGFVFIVLRIRGIVSRNVFKQSRKTVILVTKAGNIKQLKSQ